MADNPLVIGHVSAYAEMHVVIHHLRLAPLLQFHDDDILPILFICANNDEIHALGSLRNIVFNGNLHLVVNLGIIHDVPHELHGVVPGGKFAILPCVQSFFANQIENLRGNHTATDILHKSLFIGVVDNHTLDYSSLYFLAVPRALSAGYFNAFFLSFSSMISLMSR